jgi:hypothetical protein
MIDAMWIDREGVAHTVSLPDPTAIMDASFTEGLASLDESARATVRTILEGAQVRVFTAVLAGSMSPDDSLVGAVPPMGLLVGPVRVPADVAEAIQRVDPHWRLDAITALDEYID